MAELDRNIDSMQQTKEPKENSAPNPEEPSLNQLLQRIVDILDSRLKQESCMRSDRVGKRRSAYRTVFFFIVASLLILFVAYIAYKEDSRLVEPFEVPQELEKQGYTGRAIANKLIDQINLIRAIAPSPMAREAGSSLQAPIPSTSPDSPIITVQGVGISPHALSRYIKELFGQDQAPIIGEVFFQSNQLYVTVRVRGKLAKTIPAELKNLDGALRKAAEQISIYIQPFFLASYLNYCEKKDAALETIQLMLPHDLVHDESSLAYRLWGSIKTLLSRLWGTPRYDSRAYTLWGLILQKQGKYEEAIGKYQIAIKIDPQLAVAYTYWANVLKNQGKHNEAQKVLELRDKMGSKAEASISERC